MNSDAFFEGLFQYDVLHGSNDNQVYADQKVRGALYLKYFIEGSYHVRRQNILTDFVAKSKANTFVDIGYGAPGLYVEKIILPQKTKLTLLDKFKTAIDFSSSLLTCIAGDSWKENIQLGLYDFNNLQPPERYEAYILFDSIEHASSPDKSFDVIVRSAPTGAKFILSIPVCPAEAAGRSMSDPMHFIEWLTTSEVKTWIQKHNLTLLEAEEVHPTKEDLWAQGSDFYNVLILAEK